MARAREFTIGNLPVNVAATVNATVNANAHIGFLAGTYTFATPVLGAQASATLLAGYGANSTSLAGSLLGTITGPAGGVLPFSRFDSIDSNIIAFTDLIPMFQLNSPVSGGSREIVKPSWGYRIVTDDLARQQRLLSRGQFPMELARNWSVYAHPSRQCLFVADHCGIAGFRVDSLAERRRLLCTLHSHARQRRNRHRGRRSRQFERSAAAGSKFAKDFVKICRAVQGCFTSVLPCAPLTEAMRRPAVGPFIQVERIVVAIDPAMSTHEGSDETGIVVAARNVPVAVEKGRQVSIASGH